MNSVATASVEKSLQCCSRLAEYRRSCALRNTPFTRTRTPCGISELGSQFSKWTRTSIGIALQSPNHHVASVDAQQPLVVGQIASHQFGEVPRIHGVLLRIVRCSQLHRQIQFRIRLRNNLEEQVSTDEEIHDLRGFVRAIVDITDVGQLRQSGLAEVVEEMPASGTAAQSPA